MSDLPLFCRIVLLPFPGSGSKMQVMKETIMGERKRMIDMLNCEYCDYYKKLNCQGKCGMCQFTGVIFSKKPEEMEMEYPCAGVSYAMYLSHSQEVGRADGTEGADWKYAQVRTANERG